MPAKGTIYIRDNPWYKMENVIKLGISSFAKDRNNTYITGEVERGEFIYVVEIPLDKMKVLDKCLKSYFMKYNIYKGGGTEFYDRCVIDLIKPFLEKINIEFKVLTKEEINLMNRCERIRNIPNLDKIKNIFNKLNLNDIIKKYRDKRFQKDNIKQDKDNIQQEKDNIKQDNIMIPRPTIQSNIEQIIIPNDHQKLVLENIESFYKINDIGKLIWACGLGKALLGILIVKKLNFKSILIGVPSINLQNQMRDEIIKIFPNQNNILFVGGNRNYDKIEKYDISLEFKNLRDTKDIDPIFIISTYHSCYLLDKDITFDFKIGDEAHHLVGDYSIEKKGFRLFHNIKSNKTLFMTATEKNTDNGLSMDDERIFGKYIDIKTAHWAIENKKITDYNILVLKNDENIIDEIIRGFNVDNKDIFISCYMSLKSFEKYNDLTHLLLYTNTIENAELAAKYIDKILSLNILTIQSDKIYNKALHSKNSIDLNNELYEFKNKPYGIISCVYIFGEGFDFPKLNGVCIAENMQSETRIVQYLLRPNRLDFEKPNKKAYIIIPYVDSYNWAEKDSYEKVRNIIYQLRNIDESVEQKIIVSVGTKQASKENLSIINYVFDESIHELNKLKVRLRYSKALRSNFTEEQDEYNYVKSINISLKIKSKKEYMESQDIHNNYINFPEEYFKNKGVWNNWYDFMGVNTSIFIQNKSDWKHFCKEKNIKDLEEYFTACEQYEILPKEPADFYTNFTNIPLELGFNKYRRI